MKAITGEPHSSERCRMQITVELKDAMSGRLWRFRVTRLIAYGTLDICDFNDTTCGGVSSRTTENKR